MKLRQLNPSDMKNIMDLFHDENVTEYLLKESENNYFCTISNGNSRLDNFDNEIHKVIVTDEEDFVGLVSLKYIDFQEETAELRIIVKSNYYTKGYAWFAVSEILKYAFNVLNLRGVYWNVFKNNSRAIRFFDKHGFNRTDDDIPLQLKNRHINERELLWYVCLKGDDFENISLLKGTVAGCNIIKIKTIPTVEAGELSFFEVYHDVPFDIKRMYYISKVPEGVRRGFHAHKKLKQLLFCPYGKIQLILENENGREEIELSDPSIGVIIEKPTWREMLWMQKDSVLCVAASDYYSVDDYIRNYSDFKKYVLKINE